MFWNHRGTVVMWYEMWTSAPAAGVRYSVMNVFPTGMPELDDYLNCYCFQRYQPRQGAGGYNE